MAFVVYHRKSTQMIKVFALESAAKRSKTCMNRNAGSDEYAYTLDDIYHKEVVVSKKVRNLMTGEEVEIPSNTPLSCDPSSETYWSM
jgi:myo-inositol catabolism protein IolC